MSETSREQDTALRNNFQNSMASMNTGLTGLQQQIAALQAQIVPGAQITQPIVDMVTQMRAQVDQMVTTAQATANPTVASTGGDTVKGDDNNGDDDTSEERAGERRPARR